MSRDGLHLLEARVRVARDLNVRWDMISAGEEGTFDEGKFGFRRG